MKRTKKGGCEWKLVLTAVVAAISIGCAGCGAESGTEAGEAEISEVGNETTPGTAAERNEVIIPTARIYPDGFMPGGEGDAADIEDTTDTPKDLPQESVKEDENVKNGMEADTKTDAVTVYDSMDMPLLEELFSFETDEYHTHIIITGIADEYRYGRQEEFWAYMRKYAMSFDSKILDIPGDINGLPVRVIGENAFADMTMDMVRFPDSVQFIDPGAFKNTGIQDMELPAGLLAIGNGAFENCRMEYLAIPDSVQFIDERVFARNPRLWTVLVSDNSTVINEDAFADCAGDFLLCYGENGRNQENLVAAYAKENGFASEEIILSKEPIVNYHEEPLILRPRVENFFYGIDGDEEKDEWCTWEYDEAAPNFGYSDWQWIGCSSWCGAFDFEQEVEASSELSSGSGRYSADNVTEQNREAAWAEGVGGNGIGESLVYRQSCTYGTDNQWDAICQWKDVEPRSDGFMHYTEICIVNGYAKDEKTWEENGRVKQLLMYVEDRPYAYLDLEDTILPQYFTLPEDDIKVINGGMLEVRYEITDVYPGSLYEDTCLTGLVMEFSGRYAH